MPKPKHQTFLDLEESLQRRLSAAWRHYWNERSALIEHAVTARQFERAHALAEQIDLSPLIDQHLPFARTVGMSALLLGASRLGKVKGSTVSKRPPRQQLETATRQLRTMVARNASLSLRQLAHAWIESEERATLSKAEAAPLYVCRRLLNTESFRAWAKSQGFDRVDDDLHVTIAYSREPVDAEPLRRPSGEVTVRNGTRSVIPLGSEGAVVLRFDSPELQRRWQELRDGGCSWDYESYQPHVTITYQKPEALDLAAVRPYTGPLVFGPEDFEPLSLEKYDPDQPRAPAGSPDGGQWVSVTGTPEFKAWFGDSKVVDAEGRPLRLYHGTGADIEQFDVERSAFRLIFLAESAAAAGEYAMGGVVMPLFARIRNPLVLTWEEWFPMNPLTLRRAVVERGHDGVRVLRSTTPGAGAGYEQGDVWMAIDGAQLKSAFNARPTEHPHLMKFDPSQPRHPKGSPDGGRWVDLKVEESSEGHKIKRVKITVPKDETTDLAQLEATVTADTVQILWSDVEEYWQGTGLGVRMYAKLADYAYEHGKAFLSDTQVSESAQRIYAALERRGYKVERNPKAFEAKDGKLLVGWPTPSEELWVYRVTNPVLAKEDVAKLDPGDRNRNQVRIDVAAKQFLGLAASVQVSRLSAFGFLLEAAEAGLKYYRIDAVLDERTCAVCQQLDGWVFPIEQGLQQAEQIMTVDDPDALKQLAPFYAQNKQAVAELITYGTQDWIEMGMHLPPYHPLCRCILTPAEAPADLHPTLQSDRIAVAAQTLYGEGDGVRLTRELFGVELPEAATPEQYAEREPEVEAQLRRLGDVLPDLSPEDESLASWLDTAQDAGEPGEAVSPPAAERVAETVRDLVTEWVTQPSAGAPPPPLITPEPFEGSTIPQEYAAQFQPSKLARLAESRWPWLAGILGWLALRQPDPFAPSAEEAELIAEEELADDEADDEQEMNEGRFP